MTGRTFAALAVAAIVISAPSAVAAASWSTYVNEDPLTDQKIALAGVETSDIAITVKCWQGEPKETLLIVLLKGAFGDEEMTTATARTDKSAARQIAMKGKDISGRQGYFGVAAFEEDILPFVKEIAAAKSRVVFGVGGQVIVAPATGAAAAFSKFTETCDF